MSVLGNLINVFAGIWKNIGIAQKVSIVLIGVGAVAIIALIIYMGSRPNWRILYTDLDAQTAAQIYDIIKDDDVPVKITNSGRTIMVATDDIYKLKMKVAKEGINVTTKGVGWELFDNMKLGLTDKQQQIAFQRAVQGELERMVVEMPGVVSCKILLNLPQRKVFRREQSRPTASIMLVLDKGRILDRQQLNSIRYMVSSSVENMKPQDVTITDNRGNLLFRETGTDELYPVSNQQMEVKTFVERTLKEKAESILRPIAELKSVVAVVSCEMDFDQIDKVVENYEGDKAVVIQEKTINDKSTSTSGTGESGPAGNQEEVPLDNIEGSSTADVAGDMKKQERETTERKYLVPKSVEKMVKKGGKITKTSVAVTVATAKDATINVANLKTLVAKAVGTTSENVEITSVPYVPPVEASPVEVPLTDTINYNVDKFTNSPLVRPIIGLVLLFVLYRIFKQYFKKSEIEGTEMTAGLYGEEIPSIETSQSEDEKQKLVEAAMGVIDDKTSEVSPESVASVMENWLKSDNA